MYIATQTHPPKMGLGTRLIKMDESEVCERMGAIVHGVPADQLSPAKKAVARLSTNQSIFTNMCPNMGVVPTQNILQFT